MRTLPAAFALMGAAALVLASASPAFADGREIDPGDSMYTINCDQAFDDWQLFSVAPSSAVTTQIGVGGGTSEFGGCANQPAYDAFSGASYYVQLTFDGNAPHWALAEIDVATGVSTTINEFVWQNGGSPLTVIVEAIAIGPDGAAYAIGSGTLYSLDLSDATVEPIDATITTFGFASDPRTGQFYVVTPGGDLFRLDDIATSGVVTYVGSLSHPDLDLADPELTGVFALQIDGGGTFWIDVATREGYTQLWSFTLASLDAPVQSGLFRTADPFYTQALLIIPGSALAATGAGLGFAPYAAGAAGLLVLAGGAVLLARRRHARRRSA